MKIFVVEFEEVGEWKPLTTLVSIVKTTTEQEAEFQRRVNPKMYFRVAEYQRSGE